MTLDHPGRSGAMPRATSWPAALLTLGLGLILLLVALGPVWQSMATVWWTTVTYHHGFVIPLITLGLVWLRKDAVLAARPRTEPLALPLLLGPVGLLILGQAGNIQLFAHAGAVGLLILLVVVILGREVCRPIAFPLLFLGFMVPFGDFLVPHLQAITAWFAVSILRLLDIPVFADGVLITIPGSRFEVAEACAGIRFLVANVMVGTLFAYLALDRWWKWALFITLSLVVPILANALRAFGIIMIAYLSDNTAAVGVDHIVYGWGFFTLVMLLLLGLGQLMADRPVGWFPAGSPHARSGPWRPLIAAAALGACLIPPAYGNLVLRPPPLPARMAPPTFAAPPGWTLAATQAERRSDGWRPEIKSPDLLVSRRFVQGDASVDLVVGYWPRERQGAEAVSDQHRLTDGRVFLRLGSGRQRLDRPGLPAEVGYELQESGRERRLVLAWYWIDGGFVGGTGEAKLRQIGARLLGRQRPTAILLASTPVVTTQAAATATIERWLAAEGPALARSLSLLAEADPPTSSPGPGQ